MRRDGATYKTIRQARSLVLNTARRLRGVDSAAYVHRTAKVEKDLVAAPYAYVGPHCLLTSGVQIGRFSLLAHGVQILGNDHVFEMPGTPIIFSGRPAVRETRIGIDVWIGASAIIMAGSSVGDGAIVGAGSLVTTDIPPLQVWAGVPARYVRQRFASDQDGQMHLDQVRALTSPTTSFAAPRTHSL